MIHYSTQQIDEDDIKAVEDVLKNKQLTQGDLIDQLEEAICKYIGVKNSVLFNSATSALFSLYSVLGFKDGDEIITTPISFVATSNMFVMLGAKPIWCDVKLDGNIDQNRVEKLINKKTKALVVVDFAGKPVEHVMLKEIAKKNNLIYIDDACHAFGSELNGKKIGSFADASIFSFHAIKPFTTGEGGCVVTDDDELAQKLKLFRSHGIKKSSFFNSDMVMMGFNFRLTQIQAALGLSQIKKVDRFIEKRNEIASYYDTMFKNHKMFLTQKIDKNQKTSRHLYPVVLNPELHCPKEDIINELHKRGIGVQVHYKPIYKNSFYKQKFGEVNLSVANDFYKSEISLPCHQKMSLEDAKYVAENFLDVIDLYSYRGCSF